MIHFWTYVIYNGLGYHQDDGSFIVSGLAGDSAPVTQASQPLPGPQIVTPANINPTAPTTVVPQCASMSPTRIVGVEPAPCSGALIFEDTFDRFDANKWRIEQRFSGKPDFEFGVYMDRTDTVAVRNNELALSVVRLGDNYSLQFGPK